ncbi:MULTISPECIES: DUF4255 domain-containing protein [Spirulina sp. CCY15215]|uniref:DUF4255 domain-containing protein n=1 Tax=Spirulina sp. CCY15215 TaxID=2767591 RepID=UPI00194FA826|nr:DUF4255 domain-containing protein [Spirulina major]
MSNHLAIATVTATLQRLLQSAIQGDVEGARVTTVRPDAIGTATPETGVNLYLYHVPTNFIWGNSAEIQRRNRQGLAANKARTALDMHYMISFYGNDAELEPQRLLGSVIQTLTDRSSISTDMIADTLADSNLGYLTESTLTNQVEQVSFQPLNLTIEDLSKIWSVFFQTAYNLSLAYKASVVMIEGEEVGSKPLPMGDRFGGIGPFFDQPNVTDVMHQDGRFVPIEAESTIIIRGTNLKEKDVFVRIGDAETRAENIEKNQIKLSLSSFPQELLKSGIQELQVIHRFPFRTEIGNNGNNNEESQNDPIEKFRNVKSNVIPFVLRPTIIDASLDDLIDIGKGLRNATLIIEINWDVKPQQKVIIALNEWSREEAKSYLFDVDSFEQDTRIIFFPVKEVKAGNYLIRLQIDGAESKLERDTDPGSSTYGLFMRPMLSIE